MSIRTYVAPMVAGAVLVVGAPDALAGSPGSKPAAPAGAQQQRKGPGIPGKMRSTTQAERWAAATRNADRRAEHFRRHGKGK